MPGGNCNFLPSKPHYRFLIGNHRSYAVIHVLGKNIEENDYFIAVSPK